MFVFYATERRTDEPHSHPAHLTRCDSTSFSHSFLSTSINPPSARLPDLDSNEKPNPLYDVYPHLATNRDFAPMRRPLLWILVSLLPVTHASKVNVVNKPQVRVTTALVNFDARIMDQWGGGGGKAWKIANDSHHPFAQREFGGGRRRDIKGTNAFGSGYPYGAENMSSISRRSFPFGTWPLYWGDNFMESDEVGPQLDGIRPGGHLSIVPLTATNSQVENPDEVYYAIGDSQSLLSILISYVTWCHASVAWPTRFDPLSPDAVIKIDNVLRYYRASSFALGTPSFTNPQARNTSYDGTYPIPANVANSAFWQCLDSTTASSLPILNPPPNVDYLIKLVAPICTLGWIMLGVAIALLGRLKSLCVWARDWIFNYEDNIATIKENARKRREKQMEEREKRKVQLFGYERFP